MYSVPVIICSGGSRGHKGHMPPGPNSFNFIQFLGKLAKSYVSTPLPRGLVPPPQGNLTSPTDLLIPRLKVF